MDKNVYCFLLIQKIHAMDRKRESKVFIEHDRAKEEIETLYNIHIHYT